MTNPGAVAPGEYDGPKMISAFHGILFLESYGLVGFRS
jgi:hypothetical protein